MAFPWKAALRLGLGLTGEAAGGERSNRGAEGRVALKGGKPGEGADETAPGLQVMGA